jgi:hypothetical protein
MDSGAPKIFQTSLQTSFASAEFMKKSRDILRQSAPHPDELTAAAAQCRDDPVRNHALTS